MKRFKGRVCRRPAALHECFNGGTEAVRQALAMRMDDFEMRAVAAAISGSAHFIILGTDGIKFCRSAPDSKQFMMVRVAEMNTD